MLNEFRRRLFQEDQVCLDDLFRAAHYYSGPAAVIKHLLPFEKMLLTTVLAERKRNRHLQTRVERLERQVEQLLNPNQHDDTARLDLRRMHLPEGDHRMAD